MDNSIRKFLVSQFFIYLIVSVVSAQDIRKEIDSVNATSHDFIVSNSEESIQLFRQNSEFAESIGYSYGKAKSLENLGKAYYIAGEYDKSTESYLEAIKIYTVLNSHSDLATAYGEFGYQLKRRNLPKAMTYMRLAIRIGEEYNFRRELTALYDNYGVLQEMNDDTDSARYYYQKALDMKYELKDTIGIPYSLNNLAGISAMEGDYNKALDYIRLSDKFRANEEGDFGRMENLLLYANIYYLMGDSRKAIETYKECLKNYGNQGFSFHIRYSYEQLTFIYEELGDYKNAFLNQKKYYSIKDSVLNFETTSRIAELEVAYDTEKKDRQIAEKELEIKQRRIQLLLMAAVVIILIIASVWIYRSQKHKRERMRKELEFRNRLSKMELEKKMSDEKIRISRELHDNIGSHLTFIVSSMDNLTFLQKEGKVYNKLIGLSQYGRNTLKELRNTIWAMKQDDTDLSNLILKLGELKQQVNENLTGLHLEIKNEIKREIFPGSAKMLNLYRIIQEAVQNVIKYAEAENVEISFTEKHSGFELRITDDGKGFSPDKVKRGNGLRNMKSRCEESGGKFELRSDFSGTEIICTFS